MTKVNFNIEQMRTAFLEIINDTPRANALGLSKQQIYNYKQPERQTESAMLMLLYKAGKLKLV